MKQNDAASNNQAKCGPTPNHQVKIFNVKRAERDCKSGKHLSSLFQFSPIRSCFLKERSCDLDT